jgi:D-arabinose 1-dehydrogenase-like Zn-dependent alcohol dehydrogenase
LGRKTVCGSVIGGRGTMREMLDFAARHGIGARVEVVLMGEVNRAIQRVRENRARYRMVLKN